MKNIVLLLWGDASLPINSTTPMKHDHDKSRLQFFKHYLFFSIFNLIKESGRFQFSAFRICVVPPNDGILWGGTSIPIRVAWSAYPCAVRMRGLPRWTGVPLSRRIRAGMGEDGVLHLCLKILHLWRMKLSLSDEYIFSFSRSSVVSFSTLYTLLLPGSS